MSRHSLSLALLLGSLVGCSSLVRIQPLATGRADVAAYNLNGPNLQALSHEASRLCPAGLQVLSQSMTGSRMAVADTAWQQALRNTASFVDPPREHAQMMVLCLPHMAAAPVAWPTQPAMAATRPLQPSQPLVLDEDFASALVFAPVDTAQAASTPVATAAAASAAKPATATAATQAANRSTTMGALLDKLGSTPAKPRKPEVKAKPAAPLVDELDLEAKGHEPR